MDEKQQELIYQLSILQQQAQQIQEQLQLVEQNVSDLSSISNGLNELKGKKDSEMLAPLGRGIFVKAKILSEELTVDIGKKNFVKKSIPETQEIILLQIDKIAQIKERLLDELDKINNQLLTLINTAERDDKEK